MRSQKIGKWVRMKEDNCIGHARKSLKITMKRKFIFINSLSIRKGAYHTTLSYLQLYQGAS
jgi:hypothetical protein